MLNDDLPPQPAFWIDSDGNSDPLTSMILGLWRGFAILTIVGGSAWSLCMIPTYVNAWHNQPGMTGGLTQCFLAVFSPMCLGAARYYRVASQRIASRSNRRNQLGFRALGLASLAALIGLVIWDFTKLNEFLAFYQLNPEGAVMAIVFMVGSLIGGVVLGWCVGRSADEEVRRFHELVQQELEARR